MRQIKRGGDFCRNAAEAKIFFRVSGVDRSSFRYRAEQGYFLLFQMLPCGLSLVGGLFLPPPLAAVLLSPLFIPHCRIFLLVFNYLGVIMRYRAWVCYPVLWLRFAFASRFGGSIECFFLFSGGISL